MMADGLVHRFQKSDIDPPAVLYTDRDCCNETGPSKYQVLFSKWSNLQIRLDIWHFMCHLALGGCVSESHPLYSTFMSHFSACLLEWDPNDYKLLLEAKRNQIINSGLPNPCDDVVRLSVSRQELTSHCRRRARGTEVTSYAIEDLILLLSETTDTLGVPLFNDDMTSIWAEEKRLLKCLQDVPSVPLYTVTKKVTKGGITLPVNRSAQESMSLESFLHHIVTSVPGTSANAVHFQAYLLDGLARWNASRRENAIDASKLTLRSFDIKMVSKVNSLSEKVLGKKLIKISLPPNKPTGEFIGVEYLHQQSGLGLTDEDVDKQIDEGCYVQDESDSEMSSTDDLFVPLPSDTVDDNTDEEHDAIQVDSSEESIDLCGIRGWN